jgi:hypothetical protein
MDLMSTELQEYMLSKYSEYLPIVNYLIFKGFTCRDIDDVMEVFLRIAGEE